MCTAAPTNLQLWALTAHNNTHSTCTGLPRNSLNKCPTSAHLELSSNHTPNTVFVCTQSCMHFMPRRLSSLYNAGSWHVCARLHLHAGNCGPYCIKHDIYIQACILTAHTNGDLLLTWPPSSYDRLKTVKFWCFAWSGPLFFNPLTYAHTCTYMYTMHIQTVTSAYLASCGDPSLSLRCMYRKLTEVKHESVHKATSDTISQVLFGAPLFPYKHLCQIQRHNLVRRWWRKDVWYTILICRCKHFRYTVDHADMDTIGRTYTAAAGLASSSLLIWM